MLRGLYLHPSGQMPAYEWNFSDVNPPVHAWATLFLHRTDASVIEGETSIFSMRLNADGEREWAYQGTKSVRSDAFCESTIFGSICTSRSKFSVPIVEMLCVRR